MNTFMIPSKLNKPRLEKTLVKRMALIDQMNRKGIETVTVACQTGYGKSTLVSQWLDFTGIEAYAWYTLDEYDNDLYVFLTYFAQGIKKQDESIGNQLIQLLSQFQTVRQERFLQMYIAVVYGLKMRIRFVLDDFHNIKDNAIYDFLNLTITFLREQISLIILSRERIPLRLNKMRLTGNLLELTAADLKFNEEEVAAILIEGKEGDLSGEWCQQLYGLTEGWALGVKMAQLALPRGESESEVENIGIKDSTNNPFKLSGYWVEEILKSLTATQRDFLMLSAIPDSFSVDLCDQVFELFLQNSKNLMTEVMAKNLFIIRIDSDNRWFRYHHLFRALVLAHLKDQIGMDYSTRVSGVMLAVGEWYAQEGNYFEASRIFIRQGAYHSAATCLEFLWAPMDLNLTSGLWLEWAEKIPENMILERPVLAMAYGWALIDNNRIEKAKFWLTHAQKIYEKEPLNTLKRKALVVDIQQYDLFEIHILMAKAYIAAAENQIEELFYYGNKAKGFMAYDNLKKHGVIMMTLGFAHWRQTDYKKAAQCIEKGIEYERKYGESINVDHFWVVLFHLWLHAGELALLDMKAGELVDAIERDKRLPIVLPTLYLILAYSVHRQNHRDQCNTLMKKAKLASSKLAINDFEYRYLMLKTKTAIDQGALTQAKQYLQEAKHQYFPNPIPDFYTLDQLEIEIEHLERRSESPFGSYRDVQLQEPLTAREMEVLELIEIGLSNKEIGQRLFIALSTVKGYIQNIYGKLEVKRRTEAVAKAKALKLL